MRARSPHEPHRTATPPELLFDLVFVVAISEAAQGLHHALGSGHVTDGLLGYLTVFFAIWWAWMNFTWFASAYDCDDLPYRLATLVQIAGALTWRPPSPSRPLPTAHPLGATPRPTPARPEPGSTRWQPPL